MKVSALLIVLSAASLSATSPATRLAEVRTIAIVPHNIYSADLSVANCLYDHIRNTPFKVVAPNEPVDAIFLIRYTDLPGEARRNLGGMLGSAHLYVKDNAGQELWHRAKMLYATDSLARQQALDIPCALADGLVAKLLQDISKIRAR